MIKRLLLVGAATVSLMASSQALAQVNQYPPEYGYTGQGYRARVGTLSVTGVSASFAAVGPAPINVELTGTWAGTCTLKRRLPGESTYKALTINGNPWGVYTTNVSEQAWAEGEGGTLFLLDCTLTSGTVSWRISQ